MIQDEIEQNERYSGKEKYRMKKQIEWPTAKK